MALTASRLESPATSQMWLASAPMVHGPFCLRTTAVGPMPNFSVPNNSSVAVGMRNTGPTPQVTAPSLGEKKKLRTVSPRPVASRESPAGARPSWSMTGRMVREMAIRVLADAEGDDRLDVGH